MRTPLPLAAAILAVLAVGPIEPSAPDDPVQHDRSAALVRGDASAGVVVYGAPVPGGLHLLRPFQPPPSPYSAGHRGVDLRVAARSPVSAAATGTVQYAGTVAGRGVLVLVHPDGVSTEYEPVRPLVGAGTSVRRGQIVAVVTGQHAGCPGSCLHWGAKRAGQYLDPMSLLRPLGPVVLLPWPRDG
jgi:murein DD-endopeptidase MepM/ murein hydrolase activator NlpD